MSASASTAITVAHVITPARCKSFRRRCFCLLLLLLVFPVAGLKPPLEQSAARRYLSSNADCFSETPQNLSLFPVISFLIVFGF